MYLRPVSDLHNEFHSWDVPELDTDHDTVLVLAGDIDIRARSAAWLETFAARFKAVVMVLGNHDYWKDSLDVAPKRLKKALVERGLSNVHLLHRSSVIIDDPVHPVRFVGSTLWTDFMKGDPIAMHDAMRVMKDYSKIRNHGGTTNLHTRALLEEHKRDKAFIAETLNTPFIGHTVVVTHHAPSEQSCSPQYAAPQFKYENAAYFSDMNEWARSLLFTFWFHGHVHNNFRYDFGACGAVLCNPRGYFPDHLNDEFDPLLRIDMNTLSPVLELPNKPQEDYASWWSNVAGT